jgi:hypothetical protein
MTGLLQRLLPREEGFFGLFAKQAANIHEGANALLKNARALHRRARASANRQSFRA